MSSKTEHARPIAVLLAILVAAPAPLWAQASSKVEEAAALSVVAAAKAKAGQHKLCADMFVQAYKLDPSYLGYLYSAARCSQKAADLDGAEQGYRAFLARAPKEHPLRGRATDHLAEIVKRREGQQSPTETGGKKPEKPGAEQGQPKPNPLLPPPRPMPTMVKLGWGGVAGGILLLGAGTATLMSVSGDRDDLEKKLVQDRQSGLVGGISHAEATEQAATINATNVLGFTLAGLGAVAAISGVILVINDERRAGPTTTLAPMGRGLQLQVRF